MKRREVREGEGEREGGKEAQSPMKRSMADRKNFSVDARERRDPQGF